MTLEDAVKHMREVYQTFVDTMWDGNEENPYDEAFRMAIEALEEASRCRWHDLRKNPEDLPINDYGKPYSRRGIYLVKTKNNEYVACKYGYANYNWWVDTRGRSVVGHVIAWREIEPFGEDEG